MLSVQGEEHHALPLPEAERAVADGNLLRPRAEQRRDEPLARRRLRRHDALEQALEVFEEAGLPLLHTHEREVARCGDVRNPVVAAGARDRLRDIVRDVHDRERRESGGDRIGHLDARHARATSRGSRKWTFSRATVISSGGSYPRSASRSTVASTSSSGVEAPAVSPIVPCPSTSVSSSRLSPSIRAASAPAACATSTRRCAFELDGEPITSTSVAPCATISLTASWRFCVA